jgi:hypothetical protein
MAKKETKTERIFAGQLQAGQTMVTPEGHLLKVVRVDPVYDPSKPNMLANEVIAYVEIDNKIEQRLVTESVAVLTTTTRQRLAVL